MKTFSLMFVSLFVMSCAELDSGKVDVAQTTPSDRFEIVNAAH